MGVTLAATKAAVVATGVGELVHTAPLEGGATSACGGPHQQRPSTSILCWAVEPTTRLEHPSEDLGDGTVHGGCQTRSGKNCQNCCQMHCRIGCSQNSCPNLHCRSLGLQQFQFLPQRWYHWEVLVLQDWAHCDEQQGSGSFRIASQNY